MVELNKSCGADVDCSCHRDEGDHDEVVGWRSGLVTWWNRTKLFSGCSGVRVALFDPLSGHGLTILM